MRKSGLCKTVFSVLLLTGLLLLGSVPGFSRDKNETIDATAFGTGTQLGRNIGVTLIIYEWSTAEDRQVLVDAFKQGSNKGLVNARHGCQLYPIDPNPDRQEDPLHNQPANQVR